MNIISIKAINVSMSNHVIMYLVLVIEMNIIFIKGRKVGMSNHVIIE